METIVNGMCRKAIHEVPPGAAVTPKRTRLFNIGHECASAEVLLVVPPGGSCELGQQCGGASQCAGGVCQCQKHEVLDGSKQNNGQDGLNGGPQPPTPAPLVPEHSELVGMSLGSHKPISSSKLIYGIPGLTDEGKFNQILTANQMSINVVDQETLKALLSGHFLRVPTVGENCEGVCGNGAKCIRSVCACPDHMKESKGSCVQADRSETGSSSSNFMQSNNMNGVTTSRADEAARIFSELMNGARQGSKQTSRNTNTATTVSNNNGMPGNGCTSPNSECYAGSICINGLCVCRPGYRPQDGYCQISKVELGQSCFLNEQCKDNGFCLNGICSCRADMPVETSSSGHKIHHRCPNRPVAGAGKIAPNTSPVVGTPYVGPTAVFVSVLVKWKPTKGLCSRQKT
uniref:EB domain-containing protein n=1 Tax=Ditylenchus dipsaci TaxID=166011 RepID=A0A915EBW9_9BILA